MTDEGLARLRGGCVPRAGSWPRTLQVGGMCVRSTSRMDHLPPKSRLDFPEACDLQLGPRGCRPVVLAGQGGDGGVDTKGQEDSRRDAAHPGHGDEIEALGAQGDGQGCDQPERQD